jgi:hypothetical protein
MKYLFHCSFIKFEKYERKKTMLNSLHKTMIDEVEKLLINKI